MITAQQSLSQHMPTLKYTIFFGMNVVVFCMLYHHAYKPVEGISFNLTGIKGSMLLLSIDTIEIGSD